LRDSTAIRSGDYHPGEYRTFWIRDPKARQISAAPFGDRLVHHALTRVLKPVFERRFTSCSFASRTGYGQHLALEKAQAACARYAYVQKADIGKYFPSIDHDVLKELPARVISAGLSSIWRRGSLLGQMRTGPMRRKARIADFLDGPRLGMHDGKSRAYRCCGRACRVPRLSPPAVERSQSPRRITARRRLKPWAGATQILRSITRRSCALLVDRRRVFLRLSPNHASVQRSLSSCPTVRFASFRICRGVPIRMALLIGDDHAGEWPIAAKHDVASLLPVDDESNTQEHFH